VNVFIGRHSPFCDSIQGTVVVFATNLASGARSSLSSIHIKMDLLVCVILIHQGCWLIWCRVVPSRKSKVVPRSKVLIA